MENALYKCLIIINNLNNTQVVFERQLPLVARLKVLEGDHSIQIEDQPDGKNWENILQ